MFDVVGNNQDLMSDALLKTKELQYNNGLYPKEDVPISDKSKM